MLKVGDRVKISWYPETTNQWNGKTGTISYASSSLIDATYTVKLDKSKQEGGFGKENLTLIPPPPISKDSEFNERVKYWNEVYAEVSE
jgi:hypothetical protein